MGKIYTSYFGNSRRLAEAGIVPISIARYSPQWFEGHRFLFLAPSPQLLANKSLSDAEYNRIYARDVLSKVSPDYLKAQVERVSQGRPVALLCYEKDWNECHRKCVAEWFTERGLEITEFGMKPKEPEAEQLSLF